MCGMQNDLKRLREEVLGTDVCTACGTCVNLCPNIISIEDRIAVLADCQIASGNCYRYCPRTIPDPRIAEALCGDVGYGGPVGNYSNYLIARSRLSGKDSFFQYGGTVTALLVEAMRQGLIDYAVVTKAVGNFPHPAIVKNEEEIISAGGSKYALSPTNKEVNRACTAGSGKIGVVALPCQATGLRKKQLQPREDGVEKASVSLIIGLFCTWALSQAGWRALLNRHVGSRFVKAMDIPPPPANIMVIDVGGERKTIPLDEVGKHVRPGCKVCLDMTAENADISIGMVEGKAGWNTVITRTEQGASMLESAVGAGIIETGSLDQKAWDHLREASLNKKEQALKEAEARAKRLPYYERIIKLGKKIRDEDKNGTER